MTLNQSVREVSSAIALRAALRGVFGRPQKLSFVGTRLYWLEGATQELFFQELDGDALVDNPRRAIVLPSDTQAPGQRTLTKEEELLRERQRTLSEGISWYHVRERDHRVVYITSLTLFLYSPVHRLVFRVLDHVSDPSLRALFQEAPCLNMQLVHGCTEQDVFTFVCQFNVYRLRITEHQDPCSIDVLVEPITCTGKPQLEFGTADYIMQEEFDRYTGQCARGDHVLMLHTDTTMLSTVKLPADSAEQVDSIVFPRVGDANAKSSVVVATTGGSEGGRVVFRTVPHHHIEQAFLDNNRQPLGVEYITRFGFVDDNTIYFQVLDRRQENGAIFECDVTALPFVEEQQSPRSNDIHLNSSCAQMLRLLYRKSSPRSWVEVTNALHLDLQPNGLQIVGDHVWEPTDGSMYFHLLARNSSEAAAGAPFVPITHGKWNVRPSTVVPSAKQGDVFFLANRNNRLGIGLFAVRTTTGKSDPELLSRPNELVHSFAVGDSIVAYVASTADSLATLHVVNRSQTSSRAEVNVEWPLRKNSELLVGLVKPRIFTFLNPRQVPISGALFLPPNAGANTEKAPAQVPLMMYVYGGPHVQLIHDNNLELACNPVIQTLVNLGIAVAIVDNQMSNANDLVAHSVCKHRMGRFEVEEYVSWKHQLCSAPELNNCIDPTRVGIFGWSYGGYVTLLAMAQAPSEFKIGFAGAPVGDWKLYDTGYTERYMGLLTDAGALAYDEGRIAAFASGFPDELDRVFIAHGLLDENVHFSHSCDVINALVENGKPYSALIYPGERHGLRQKKLSRPHYDALLIKTILSKL